MGGFVDKSTLHHNHCVCILFNNFRLDHFGNALSVLILMWRQQIAVTFVRRQDIVILRKVHRKRKCGGALCMYAYRADAFRGGGGWQLKV